LRGKRFRFVDPLIVPESLKLIAFVGDEIFCDSTDPTERGGPDRTTWITGLFVRNIICTLV
jgi:hypothetical protein